MSFLNKKNKKNFLYICPSISVHLSVYLCTFVRLSLYICRFYTLQSLLYQGVQGGLEIRTNKKK